MKSTLTEDNYKNGFLVDDHWMAGIAPSNEKNATSGYSAFILDHATGGYVTYQAFSSLPVALNFLNSIQRDWIYESTSTCGNENCAIGGCGKGFCKKEACKLYIPN
jgi:hypothetical protein